MSLHKLAGYVFWLAVIVGFCLAQAGEFIPEKGDALRHVGEDERW